MPHTHTQQVRTKYKQLRTSVIRTGNQRYIDNTRQPADKINRRFKESGSSHRSTVAGFSARVKCCKSSVRRLRHHAWNDVRGGWWYRSPRPELETGPSKPICFFAWSHTSDGTDARRSRASARFCADSRRRLGFILYPNVKKSTNAQPTLRVDIPVKTRQIANGVVDRDESEWRGSRLGDHGACDIPVREVDFEAVRRREVVRWFWCGRKRVTAPRCEEEESHAGLWGAVVRCLEQAEADLVAAACCSVIVLARRGWKRTYFIASMACTRNLRPPMLMPPAVRCSSSCTARRL
jgi:hypothetical protein